VTLTFWLRCLFDVAFRHEMGFKPRETLSLTLIVLEVERGLFERPGLLASQVGLFDG
jgi:hypothetical protein